MQAWVFKGERRYMMDVIGKLVIWQVQIEQILVQDNVTSIYVQAPKPAVTALHKALKKEQDDRYYGLN